MFFHWFACVGILTMFVGFFYVFESKEMKQMNRNHPDKVRFFFHFRTTTTTFNETSTNTDKVSISCHWNGRCRFDCNRFIYCGCKRYTTSFGISISWSLALVRERIDVASSHDSAVLRTDVRESTQIVKNGERDSSRQLVQSFRIC